MAHICIAKKAVLEASGQYARDDIDWHMIQQMLVSGKQDPNFSNTAPYLPDTYITLGSFWFTSIVPLDDALIDAPSTPFGIIDYYTVIQSFFCCSIYGVNIKSNAYRYPMHTLLQDKTAKDIFFTAFTKIGVSYEYSDEFIFEENNVDYMPVTGDKVNIIIDKFLQYNGTYVAYLILHE